MFKLPKPPSPQAEIHELADYAEFLALKNGASSSRDVVGYLNQIDENDNNIGCDDNDDINAAQMDEVMTEIHRRLESCNGRYPFALDESGTIVRFDTSVRLEDRVVYLYLLLSTRLNMTSSKVQDGIDGTELLEDLSACVLRNYLGGNRAKSFVFGTATRGAFSDKITDLCCQLNEGSYYRSLDSVPPSAKDDKLDAVAWVPFCDRSPGQLIIFGQCKTGTTWRDHVSQLQPDAFIKRWMTNPYLIDPLRAFCVSEAVNRSRWNGLSVYSGLLFDRCRLMDYSYEIPEILLTRMESWNTAAWSGVISTL